VLDQLAPLTRGRPTLRSAFVKGLPALSAGELTFTLDTAHDRRRTLAFARLLNAPFQGFIEREQSGIELALSDREPAIGFEV